MKDQYYFDDTENFANALPDADLATLDPAVMTEDELAAYIAANAPELSSADSSHYANLVDTIDGATLSRIATDVIDWAETDEQSRSDWFKREQQGMRMLGVTSKQIGSAPFQGASDVVHPLLIEAVTQFHARAIAEVWPPEGPVKTVVLGTPTPETNAQAERVQDFMNYLYTHLMPGGFEEEDQLLFRLPFSGSCFKKVYYDHIEQCVVSRFVEPVDFLVPYSALDLRTAPRYTHRTRVHRNDIRKLQNIGYYSDVELGQAVLGGGDDYPIILDEQNDAQGVSRIYDSEDDVHTLLEMYVDLDIDGIDEAEDEFKGVALPYVVTVDKDNQQVLRIQRNWRETDTHKRKRVNFVHKKFMPGFGFYGFGLYHLIGGMTNAATGALRAILDNAAYLNLQGGFVSKDARMDGGDKPIAPGEWRRVSATSEELEKAFFPLPKTPYNPVLFQVLGYLDERGQRFASTSENMVGEAKNTAPVGTTLALIEQGSKVFASIHKRLHEANAKEYQIAGELCGEYLSDEGYPYFVKGGDRFVMTSDFDERVDIIPVSDPAIFSSTQRVSQAQAVLDLAEKFPDVINRRMAVQKMLEVMRVADIELIMQPESTEPSAEEKLNQAKAEEIAAKTELTKAKAVETNVKSTYSAMQSGQAIASMPPIVPIADSVLASAGFEDRDGAPVAVQPGQAVPLPTRYSHQVRENIDGIPTQPNTDPLTPTPAASPAEGFQGGIETLENDL